jgi:hypothetical protein
LASPVPPSYSPRPPRASKLDPFLGTIEELLEDEPTLSGVPIREELEKRGYEDERRSSTICCASCGRAFAAAAQLSAHPLTALAS